MTVKSRILAIKLMEKQSKYPQYIKKLGLRVEMADLQSNWEKKISVRKEEE